MFRLYLLNNLSAFEYAILYILLFSTYSFLVYKISHYFLPKLVIDIPETANFYLFFIASYAFLFAFTIMLLWQTYLSAKNVVLQESGSLSKIVFNSNTFNPSEKDAVHRAIQNYIKIVVSKEWPMMNKGNSSEEAGVAFINIGSTLEKFKNDQNGNIFYRDAITDFGKAFEARRTRIALLESIIPNSLYYMILLILLITLTALSLQKKSTSPHVVLLLFSSAIFGLSFAVLTAFDFPFAGKISISPEPYTRGMLASLYYGPYHNLA